MSKTKPSNELRITGPVYAMNSKTCKYLIEHPESLSVAITCYHEYYKTVTKAAKDLRKQINRLISGAKIVIEKQKS